MSDPTPMAAATPWPRPISPVLNFAPELLLAAQGVRAAIFDVDGCLTDGRIYVGEHGEEGIFSSIPCVVGANGIEETFELPLNEREQVAFRASCEHIRGNIAQLGEWWNTESRVK